MGDYELGIVGAGNMAEAIIRGVIDSSFLQPEQIIACDVSAARREYLSGELGITCVDDSSRAALQRRVLLAIKPQVMGQVLTDIARSVSADATVVSIVAGVPASTIDSALGGRGRIVRTMPNTPLLVGEGMTAIAPGPRAGEEDLQWASQLFAASGKTVVVGEEMIDAVTAVSGSGPAYFFYLVEAMCQAGIDEGLDPDVSLLLARQTARGAAELLVESTELPVELRRRVTSPGGTTQRAIETMDSAGVKDSLVRAIRAAAERSRELGK